MAKARAPARNLLLARFAAGDPTRKDERQPQRAAFFEIETIRYWAAGLWCTGGFGDAFCRSSVPFSMTIMKGFGV